MTSGVKDALRPKDVAGRLRGAARGMALSALSRLRRAPHGNFLRCLYCHYVFDDQRPALVNILRELRSLGEFIDTGTCIEIARGKRIVDGRYFHLSFDDGFRNVVLNAVPALSETGVPALFNVPAGFLESPPEAARAFFAKAGIYRRPLEFMRWSDVAGLIQAGFDIGSHTSAHVRLKADTAGAGLLKNEITGSKQEIEKRTQRACRVLAWPYGAPEDFGPVAEKIAREAGYEACFGAFRGAVTGGVGPYRIPRHHFEPEWPLSHIRFFARGGWE